MFSAHLAYFLHCNCEHAAIAEEWNYALFTFLVLKISSIENQTGPLTAASGRGAALGLLINLERLNGNIIIIFWRDTGFIFRNKTPEKFHQRLD